MPRKVTLVRELQPANATSPMFVTLSGIVTLVRPLQPENVSYLMLVTVFPISTSSTSEMLDMELLISAPSMLKVYSLGVIPLSSVYFTLVSG